MFFFVFFRHIDGYSLVVHADIKGVGYEDVSRKIDSYDR